MPNVNSNIRVVSSDLERFDAYDKITHFVLYYSKARAYTVRIHVSPLLDKIAPGVFSFELHAQPFSLDREYMLVSFFPPPPHTTLPRLYTNAHYY